MLTKCYPTLQECSCDFPRLKIEPLGVPKPYRTSSYDLPSLLTRSTLFVICWILWKICGINIFLGSESMDRHLSNALSTMFLWHLVMFLHFESYAFSNAQKAVLPGGSGVELDFLPHIYTIMKSCSEQSSCRDLYTLLSCFEPFLF